MTIISGKTVRNIRTKIYNSNGDIIDLSLTLSPLRDKDGKTSETIGVSKYITDVMTAEAGLREKIVELEKWQRLTVGREMIMADLKSEIRELKEKIRE